MTTKTVYPGNVSQSTGIPFRQFYALYHIKSGSSTYTRSENISGGIGSKAGTYNTPSRITSTNFNANIPAGATINSVTVEFASMKEGYIGIGRVGADLEGVDLTGNYGKALTNTMATSSVKFESSKLTPSVVNSPNFGVTLYFPKNSTYNTGYVRVQFVRLLIDYTLPNYTITANKVNGEFTDENQQIQVQISNVNKTSNDSIVTITLPENVSFTGKESGDGNISSVGNIVTWTPGLNKSILSRSIIFNVATSEEGTYNLSFKESLSNHTSTLQIVTTVRPAPSPEELDEESGTVFIEPDSEVVAMSIQQNKEFIVYKTLTSEQITAMTSNNTVTGKFYIFENDEDFTDEFVTFNTETGKYDYTESSIFSDCTATFDTNGNLSSVNTSNGKLIIDTTGYYSLILVGGTITSTSGTTTADLQIAKYNIEVYPETLSAPILTIIKPSQEELDRLGNGHTYTVQTYLREVTSDEYVRNWGNNFRLGIFNNPILSTQQIINSDEDETTIVVDPTNYNSLSADVIFENAEYWSKALSSPNTYENVTVEFPYNKDYPLYIIVTGDYTESSNHDIVKYTEPCIVESAVYNNWEKNGNYPVKILDTLKAEDSSQLAIQSFDSSTSIIVYDAPVEDLITDKYFIKGISISFDIEYTDYLSLNVKLNTGKGKGERSIILEPTTVGTVTLGDQNDRWNLKPSQLVNPEDWEFEIQYTNVFNSDNSNSEVFFNNIVVTYYLQEIEEQGVSIFVDGEDLAIYNAFITEISIPSGLETDTDLIHITGTDLNDAYLQTIREKTITITLSVIGCDLEESTRNLQELTTLLTNERDELNKPIPKRLEISNYPNIHWNYVMKDPIDAEVNIVDYDCKIKLLVPSGTAYTNEEILTSTVGKIGGIAKVNPRIQFIPLASHIEISEKNSGQKFTMNYSSWSNNDKVVIDCANRTVILNETTDLTKYVDYDADWFSIYGEFEFQPTNAIIQTISRYERM